MNTSSNSHNQRTALWIFVLLPTAVVVLTEMFKTHLVWRLRIVDFVDLVLMAPFFLVMLLYFTVRVFSAQKERRLYFVALGLIGIALYGHAMHLTANAINTYSTEIHHYLDRIPPDTYELIYFFDEDLGHWLLYAGLIGLLGVWIISDQAARAPSWQDWVTGGVFGLSYAIAFIESSQPWLGFVAAFWLVGCVLWRGRGKGQSLLGQGQALPLRYQSGWARFGLAAALLLIIGELLYLLIMGSFIEPSKMGL